MPNAIPATPDTTNPRITADIGKAKTQPIAPSTVLSKTYLYNGLTDITNAYSSYSSFGGVAVDYLDPFLVLK